MMTVAVMRMLERIVAVIIGGISIYLGYRLFILLPTQTEQSGKIKLPGFSVVLSKVGPGIFFSVLGTIVIFLSFYKPVHIIQVRQDGDFDFVGGMAGASNPVNPIIKKSQPSVTPQDVSRIKNHLQIINCMEQVVNSQDVLLDDEVEVAVQTAKVLMMKSVWKEEKWGSQKTFMTWATKGDGNVSEEVKLIYDEVFLGCSKQQKGG